MDVILMPDIIIGITANTLVYYLVITKLEMR